MSLSQKLPALVVSQQSRSTLSINSRGRENIIDTPAQMKVVTKPVLVLIRGLPGTGKSYTAERMTGYHHYEANQYFQHGDFYIFAAEKLASAHDWCKKKTEAALSKGHNVVVANTFVKLWEMQPYFDLAKRLDCTLKIEMATGNYPNIHNVPKETIKKMKRNWETSPQ